MKRIFISLIFALVSLFCFVKCQNNPHPPEVFKINLDAPPAERFKEVVLAKKNTIREFMKVFKAEYYNLPRFVMSIVGHYEEAVYQHHECREELQGIAKYSGLMFGEVFLLNFIYEILASCTSIITVDKDGYLIHGRNLDYPFQPYLGNLTVRFEFYRNGSLLYLGDGIAGYLGLATGLRPNGFGISINERNHGDLLPTVYEVLFRNTFSVPFFVRKVLETAENYKTAVKMLISEEIAAPVYLTISGINKNEGAVIARDRLGVYNITELDVDTEDRWFLVQTNYDRDVADPQDDYRRIPAEKRMREIGRKDMTRETLYEDVLILLPNKREDTITSCTMSPRTGSFDTTVWY